MVLKCEILLDILSMKFILSKEQKRELLEELHLEEGRRCAERIKSILLLEEGKPISRIAEYLFLDEGTVRNYVKRYKSGGLRKLISNNYKGRSSYLSEEQKKVLSMTLESRVYSSTKEIIKLVKSKFNITYTINGMNSLLHELGFSYKKPKGVPGKADIKEQKEFIKTYNKVKKKGLVFFADSTHPMLNPVLSAGWIKKGAEFKVKTNSGRQRVNINGAIEIKSLDVISRSCEKVNKNSICDLLRAIRSKHPKERVLHLVLDNAPYNRSYKVQKLALKLKIKILYLPPYSPNLNPIERFWKFVKRRVMANTYFPDIKTFRKELMLFLRDVRQHKQELSSLINDNFHIIET